MSESSDFTNHPVTGAITGIVAPVLAFCIFSMINYSDVPVSHVILNFAKGGVLTHVISLSVIINLLIFFLFIWSGRDKSARGVLGSTILYALVVLILKLT